VETESSQKPQPCPYFPQSGLVSDIDLIESDGEPKEQYNELLPRGYRRIGGFFYNARCEGCNECVPIRLRPELFVPSKGQRRTLRDNTDVRVELRVPTLDGRRLALYNSYLHSKHPSSADASPEQHEAVLASMHYGYPAVIEMDYYVAGTLVGVGIVDETHDALSANYFYYDTTALRRRPGVFSILMEIEIARRLGKKHYYLGYWIKGTPKMSYKADFRPHELLIRGSWQEESTAQM